MAKRRVPRCMRMPLSELRPNPLQRHFSNTNTEGEDAALEADLRQRGQHDPIVVMPPQNTAGFDDYTILDGHRRAEALRANGETEAEVIVRHDLVNAELSAVEAEFLKFNLVRRQLHPVDHVRLELRLLELQSGRRSGRLTQAQKAAFRDRIAGQLNMTPRNAGRYVRLAGTPVEVQEAVRDGHLSLVNGERVSDLNERDRAEVAERIRAGEAAKSVVAEFIVDTGGRHQKPVQALEAFVRSLRRGLDDLDGRLDRVRGTSVATHREVLEEAKSVIAQLLSAVDKG